MILNTQFSGSARSVSLYQVAPLSFNKVFQVEEKAFGVITADGKECTLDSLPYGAAFRKLHISHLLLGINFSTNFLLLLLSATFLYSNEPACS